MTTHRLFPSVQLGLPTWVADYVSTAPEQIETPEQRMTLAIALARMNIHHGTGGPFGAAIFRLDTHELIAPGVNLVVTARCAIAHAEIMALMLAQQVMGTHNLADSSIPPLELVSSCEPCVMCGGAIIWSGISRLLCGARGSDATAIGFDEGPKREDWASALTQRGITVMQEIQRHEARNVLQDYANRHGIIYNARGATRDNSPTRKTDEARSCSGNAHRHQTCRRD